MAFVSDYVRIPAPPERVWVWFADIAAHYRDWHPEHIEWRTLSGSPVTAGSVVFFDEWIGRFLLSMLCRIAEARPGRLLRYAGMWPFSMVRAGGSFALKPAAEGCDLTAEEHMGWSLPLLGPFLDRLVASVFPFPDLRRHMAEEERNLTRILGK